MVSCMPKRFDRIFTYRVINLMGNIINYLVAIYEHVAIHKHSPMQVLY